MAVDGVVSDSLWETLEVVLGTVGLVSSGWVTSETVVSGFPAETVIVGIAELVSVWVTPEAIVSGLSMESVTVGKTILVSAMELVTSEVTNPGTPSEAVVAGTAELVSVPGLVALDSVVSDSLWETLEVVLGTVRLVSSGWVTSEIVVSGFPAETVIVGIAELVSFPEWATSEAVVFSL